MVLRIPFHLKRLGGIAALFLLLSLLYSWQIPPFESPDGPEHFAYIVWLAEGRGFPPQGAAAWETPMRQEASQPPLYYLLASVPARLLGTAGLNDLYRSNPHFPSSAPGYTPDNKNIARHDLDDGRPFHNGWLAYYLARATSFLWGLALITAVYYLALYLLPDFAEAGTMAALLTALNPQVIFLSGVVTNDIAAAAASAVTLWLLARLLRRGPTAAQGAALGLAWGAAALCKTNTLALGLPLALAFVWLWRERPSNRLTIMQTAVAASATFALTAGWWYGRNWLLYGSPLGLDTHFYAPWAIDAERARLAASAEWLEVFYSFWAAFGWGNIKFPGWVYGPLLLLCFVGVVGVVKRVVTIHRQGREGREGRETAVLYGLMALTIVGVAAALEVWMRQVTAPHGRLLFPALAAMMTLLLVGWRAIHPRLPWAAVAYSGALALLAPILLLNPAYAPPQTLTAAQAAALGEPLSWQFADVAQLYSVVPLVESVGAGETLPVQVCWRPLRATARPHTVLLQLVGPENRVVARRASYPGLGAYPTSSWLPDRLFCDLMRVDIPADLAQTLLYQVEISLLDWETMSRLEVVGGDGRPVVPFAAQVRLAAAAPDAPPVANTAEPIQLLSYQLADLTWVGNGRYPLTLVWQANRPLAYDYILFVHLRPLANGAPAAQADGPPLDGWYPTSWWAVGERVVDGRAFILPADTAPGQYELVVGWYDGDTGERFGPEYPLAAIEVR